jgi:hypothetical protein
MAWVCFSLIASAEIAGSQAAVADSTPASSPTPPKQDAAAPANAAEKKPPDQAPTADTPAVVVDDNNVESLLGKDVKSAAGEKLGQITDILVSHSGAIRAAVIDFGGFLGVGSRKIAVAWPTLHFSPSAITLGMTRDELRVTPEYHQGEPIVIVGAAAASQTQKPPPAAQQSPPATTK